MKRFNPIFRIYLSVLLTIFLKTIAQSQSIGGNGRGDARTATAQIFLTGSEAKVFFKGGIGDGNSVERLNLSLLSGQSYNSPFPGGIGSGYSSFKSGSFGLNGLSNGLNSSGGSGRGDFSLITNFLTLNGVIQESKMYRGGIGGSSSKGQVLNSLLNGNSATVRFPGGFGHGSKFSGVALLIQLNGSPFTQIFQGGSGRGDRRFNSAKFTLNGVPSNGGLRVAHSPISNFTAEPEGDNVHLIWTAGNPQNVRQFEIQKSKNGIDFNSIGLIQNHKKGNHEEYFFTHFAEKNIDQYFRLVTLGIDSSTQVSDILKIRIQKLDESVNFYPVPAKESITVEFTDGTHLQNQKISILDITGKTISSQVYSEENKFIIDTRSLIKGIYFISMSSESGIKRLRFVKE